jgi:DNA mismatch endonuclease, patch repair protein
VFRRERVAIFVDGCFWHSCPTHGNVPRDPDGYWAAKLKRNIERDIRNNRDLESAGWLVLRIWEHDDPEAAADRVQRALRERRDRTG